VLIKYKGKLIFRREYAMGEIYEKGLVKYEKVVKKNLQDANALI
jgi:hypothetical protein